MSPPTSCGDLTLNIHSGRYVKTDTSNYKSSQQPFAIQGACAVAVQLIVEGGPITLSIVEHAIRQGMPVIVLEGSGRCADVISYAWRFLHDPSISARTKYVEVPPLLTLLES